MVLGDLGAEVWKIEAKNRPDITREMSPQVDGVSSWYQVLNRNKKILAWDLKNTNDWEKAKELIARTDVVLEGFRPRVMQRLGCDYATLKKIKPDLVYCSLSGYGQSGSYAQKAGHDINFLALSSINSFSSGSRPPLMGIQIADVCGGALYAVVAILTALLHKQRTGEGQYIDVSLLDTSIALAAAPLSKFLAAGILPQSNDDLLNGGSYYGYYQTRDERYLSVGAIEPKFRQVFASALGLEKTEMDRDLVATKIKSKTLKEWQEIFKDKDCCVEASLNCAEMFDHPLCQERELVVEVPYRNGSQKQVAHPVKYSTFKPVYRGVGGEQHAPS